MKRSTFVKGSLPIVTINAGLAITASNIDPTIFTHGLYKTETILSTIILTIGTITLQNNLGDKYSQIKTLCTFGSLAIAYLLWFTGAPENSLMVHIVSVIFALANYIRLCRVEKSQAVIN